MRRATNSDHNSDARPTLSLSLSFLFLFLVSLSLSPSLSLSLSLLCLCLSFPFLACFFVPFLFLFKLIFLFLLFYGSTVYGFSVLPLISFGELPHMKEAETSGRAGAEGGNKLRASAYLPPSANCHN